jgi:hypothetical protein
MSLRFALAAAMGSVAAMMPWVAFLASWMEVLSLRGVLGFADMQQTAEVVAFEHTVTAPDLASFARDRLVGLYQAFDPRSAYSYVRHMGWLVYLVPLGAFHFLLSRVRAPGSFSLALEARYVLPAAMVISGAGLLLPVHLLHMAFYKEWLFGHRQGLPIVLLVLPALVYVDAYAGRAWRYVAAAALVVSLGLNGFAVREGLKEYFKPGISPVGHELVAWLDAQSPRPAVVTAKSHKLSIFSDSGFHWTLCHSPPETTLDLLRFARAQYVLVFPSERKCNFIRGLWPEYLTRIEVFGKRGRAIWVLKPHAGALEREDWRDD